MRFTVPAFYRLALLAPLAAFALGSACDGGSGSPGAPDAGAVAAGPSLPHR